MNKAHAATPDDASRLTEPFANPIEPVRVSVLYRLALFLVALAMVLLPLIYLAVVGLVGWGLFWHATENASVFKTMGSGSTRGALFVYVAPLIVGAILLLFMIKPIFARRPKTADPVTLDPREEPTLFAFVERLCAAVGASKPRQIHVDHQVNASAGFRRGLWSMAGNDLVLTIGLPLVSGFTLRQFAGVLAHEFGHFAQGTGMRVTYVIRTVNYWFARVVYDRDAWDVKLEQWSKETDLRLGIVLYMARFFVWLTRRVLWALMMVGHVISCLMLRQMEFDADRYEARVAGSDTFESTVYRLQELGAANQQAMATLGSSWRSGQLADDLPALIQASAERLPEQVGEAIQNHVRTAKTGQLDTHPADADRIESAKREASEGVFHLQDPATVLFQDFEGLSRRVTTAFYAQNIDREIPQSNLVPTAALVQGQQALNADVQILNRYFRGAVPVSPPLALPPETSLDPPEDMRDAYRELREARRLVEEGADAANRRNAGYQTLDRSAISAAQALELLRSGYKIEPREFGLTVPTVEEAETVLERTLAERRAVEEQGGDYLSAIHRRLTLALQLIRHPQARERLDDGDAMLAAGRRHISTLACLRPALDEVDELHRAFSAFSCLIQVIQNNEATEGAGERLQALAGDLAQRLARLRERCDSAYPSAEGEDSRTIGAHAVEEVPTAEDLGAVHTRAEEAVDRIYALYQKTLASLVGSAARVEGALGMPPLPELPRESAAAGD